MLAVAAATLLIDAALLPNSVTSPSDAIIFVQAIHRAVLAIGLLLIAIFGVLIVFLIPERDGIETP